MEDLVVEYSNSGKLLYGRIKTLEKDTVRYRMLFSEYQDICFVKRQLKSYCKIVGMK